MDKFLKIFIIGVSIMCMGAGIFASVLAYDIFVFHINPFSFPTIPIPKLPGF